jgi:hypothetical protein
VACASGAVFSRVFYGWRGGSAGVRFGSMRHLSQALLLACAAVLFGTVSVVPAVARTASPRALYRALLASPIPQVQLPKGFHAAKPIGRRPGSSPSARRHHVWGEVEIGLDKKGFSGIVYGVFPRRADAFGNYRDEVRLWAKDGLAKHLPGFPQPAVIINATLGGIHFTQIRYLAGSVDVTATVGGRNGSRRADALALARVALRHLKAVEQP